MFARWGDLVFRLRFGVLGAVIAGLLTLGFYGIGVENHLSASGLEDPGSESARAAQLSDQAWGRDHESDVLLLFTAPEGATVDDPAFADKVIEHLDALPREHPDQITGVNGAYWPTETGRVSGAMFADDSRTHAFASLAIRGDNDTEIMRNYRDVEDALTLTGVDMQVAGLQPIAVTLQDTLTDDIKRVEVLALPVVAVLLFFIFGGVVAAALPLAMGVLTIAGANGIIRWLTTVTDVNILITGVVSMIGIGLAIDYGLFIVSRFREELAAGHDTPAAVRRAVTTAGRTVVFSAVMIVASLGGLLLFPQGFLKSLAYGAIAAVLLAALCALTILPAALGILGPRVDMLGVKRFRRTKSAAEVEQGFWARTTDWVLRRPGRVAAPILLGLVLLIVPMNNLAFGGMSETYLPPDNSTRLAQAEFDETFPLRQPDPLQLVVITENRDAIGDLYDLVNEAPGLRTDFSVPADAPQRDDLYRLRATLEDADNAGPTIDYLRALDLPADVTLLVGGQPAIQHDTIDTLLERMPIMIVVVLLVTTLLMFLTFGSLILPIKAALMSALGLGSTLGILTWIFIDGHGAGLLNFTPQPIMSAVLVVIIAVVYGLSTDYEVFLLSRMVEARARGATTAEAIRAGTAHTGGIITAAALILLVVTGAFAFSDLVMMQYVAYGMIAALLIDATILRMLLVPAVMQMLGDRCWWAPTWMRTLQRKLGLTEPLLDDEPPEPLTVTAR